MATFLFTDIEGSTQRWEHDREATSDEKLLSSLKHQLTDDELSSLLAEGARLLQQRAVEEARLVE